MKPVWREGVLLAMESIPSDEAGTAYLYSLLSGESTGDKPSNGSHMYKPNLLNAHPQ
jgi:hypothetical protein